MVEDKEIVKLFLERSEDALLETQEKYERYAQYIAYNILNNNEDVKDCVNQAYLKIWDSIPPHAPENLATYLAKVVRNLALDMYDKIKARKRGAGQVALVYDELTDCVGTVLNGETIFDEIHLTGVLDEFLWSLPQETRMIFVQRYWYLCSIKEIAKEFHMGESKVKMTLLRTREKLRQKLEEEGIYI